MVVVVEGVGFEIGVVVAGEGVGFGLGLRRRIEVAGVVEWGF